VGSGTGGCSAGFGVDTGVLGVEPDGMVSVHGAQIILTFCITGIGAMAFAAVAFIQVCP